MQLQVNVEPFLICSLYCSPVFLSYFPLRPKCQQLFASILVLSQQNLNAYTNNYKLHFEYLIAQHTGLKKSILKVRALDRG